MTNLNALLALGAAKTEDTNRLSLGTVTVQFATTVRVLLDGAETDVLVTVGAHAADVGDRVIVATIGRSLYMLLNLNR